MRVISCVLGSLLVLSVATVAPAADGLMNFGFGDFRNWPEAMRLLNLPDLAEREDLIPDIGRWSSA